MLSLGWDFYCARCPQGRELDIVGILKDRESVNELSAVGFLSRLWWQSCQKVVKEGLEKLFFVYTGGPYFKSIPVYIILLYKFWGSIILCMIAYSGVSLPQGVEFWYTYQLCCPRSGDFHRLFSARIKIISHCLLFPWAWHGYVNL